ncbi:MAG: hypothetical protein GY835_28380, partial [bacterium]|nr:hypothetical protein [bacterium]
LVAEQRPGPADILFVPGPSVPKWISARIPEHFEEMIYVQNKDGEMEQMEVESPTVGEVIAEDDEVADQEAELREILIPEPRELLLIDKPRLAEASFEQTPLSIQITRLAFQKKKQEKKQAKKKYGKGGGSLHGVDSPDDYSDDADMDHDYSGSECQMVDEHGNPWPRGFI